MSKGYTISYFINYFSNVSSKDFTKVDFWDLVSPVYGYTSVKAEVLNTWLNGETHKILNGDGDYLSLGKTPKTRLLNALKLRKNKVPF